jgi:hypothetical protein
MKISHPAKGHIVLIVVGKGGKKGAKMEFGKKKGSK